MIKDDDLVNKFIMNGTYLKDKKPLYSYGHYLQTKRPSTRKDRNEYLMIFLYATR